MRNELYSVESNDSGPGRGASRTVKLQEGKHEWRFCMRLPKGVSIPSGGKDGSYSKYALPTSYSDSSNKTAIKYGILVRVKKGALSSGHK